MHENKRFYKQSQEQQERAREQGSAEDWHLAAVVAGGFLSCWPVGRGEPSSR